jgi:hypothetical protein
MQRVMVPAFRVELDFAGLRTTSWVTDTGEVLREASPLGLTTVRESAQQAQAMSASARTDLLEGAAVMPDTKGRIDEPRDVRRLRVRLTGADLSSADVQGAGQSVDGDVVDIRDPQSLGAGPADPDASRFLAPEAFIESGDPAIVQEQRTPCGRRPARVRRPSA